MFFVGLFVSCKKEEVEKPKVIYETTSKAKPEVVSDANQIEVADLPINMDGTNFLIHPIGVMSGNGKGIKSSYDSDQGFTVQKNRRKIIYEKLIQRYFLDEWNYEIYGDSFYLTKKESI